MQSRSPVGEGAHKREAETEVRVTTGAFPTGIFHMNSL